MMSYSNNWFTLLLPCTSPPLFLCCDRFDGDSRKVKREPVDLVTEDYDVSLCQQISKFCVLSATIEYGCCLNSNALCDIVSYSRYNYKCCSTQTWDTYPFGCIF